MSLYQNASLAMIPSAVKDGKLYSIRPSDGSGDFTFSRGSNLAATRVDVNGLIEKGRENLLLQSNQFDTTWATLNASVTGGQSGYDGTNDAWAFTDNNATNIHSLAQYGKWTSSVCTGSIYVKAGSLSKFYVSNGSSGIGVFFNLSNGSVEGVTGAVIAQSITSVGGDWYRLSVTIQSAGTFLIGAYQTFVSGNYNASINYTGTGTGTIYIQDAQLEVGLVATDYIETTTTTAVSGITEDLPRLDYSGGASCPSLLLEPTRTNYYTNSEYFNGAGWIIGRSSLTHNDATSPEGLLNAVKWQMTSVTGAHYLRQSRTSTDTWSLSIFVKKGNYRYIGLRCAASNAAFDLDTGTFSSGSGYVETLDNGWYRIGLTETGNGTFQYYGVYYANSNATERNDATGNEYYHIYGAQLESNASYPSSYIPTYGSAVTRSKDSMNNSSLGLTDCTFFVDFVPLSSVMGLLDFYDNSNSRIFYIAINSVKYLQFNNVKGGTIGNVLGPLTIGDRMKLAFTLNASNGDVTIFINGTKYSTYSTNISSLNKILQVASFGYFNNTEFNQIISFPTILTDSEAIALTTL